MAREMKQRYHLEADRGLLNDPNGLAYFHGKYYIFFQWNRFEKNHSYKEWGGFVSEDLIHWNFQGSALIPDQSYDIHGVYSGSGYVIQDKLCLFYTGNNKTNGARKSRQCLAVTKDGRRYLKKGPILETPADYTEHFRDPNVFRAKNQTYFMLVGAQRKNGKGALALCRSENGETWEYSHMLATSEEYEMIECPDLFELDGQYVLLYNPQSRDNMRDETTSSFSVYKLQDFDEETGNLADTDLDTGYTRMDLGFDFYSPQTLIDDKGRRILVAWMSRMDCEQEEIFAKDQPNIHCMTMLRELHLRNGRLIQNPVQEMYQLLGEPVSISRQSETESCAKPQSRTFYMSIQNIPPDRDIRIDLHREEVLVQFDRIGKTFTLSRRNWLTHEMESKSCTLDRLKNLELWSDSSSVELFVNDGEEVLSARIYPEETQPNIRIVGIDKKSDIRIQNIHSHKEE
ncbi:MAG: glycoside hydrolase family 32 protein [Eubacteriales bacterium]|nr:glycoside hydrolase family 32 protein [Eubacteriales bacterium]